MLDDEKEIRFLMRDKVVMPLSGATWNQHSKSSLCSCIGAHRSLIGIEIGA